MDRNARILTETVGRWAFWIVFLALLLGSFPDGASGVKVISQNSTYIEVESDQAFYSISGNTLTIWVKLPGGRRSNPYTSQYINIAEMFRFKVGTTCYAYGLTYNLTDWNLSIEPGSDTTPTIVTSSAYYGFNNWCKFSSRYYLVNSPMTISVANKSVVIAPGEIKYSFSLKNCSSFDQLLSLPEMSSYNLPDTQIVGRYGGPRIKLTFFQDPALLPMMIPTGGFDIPPTNGSINGFWDMLCSQVDPFTNKLGPLPTVPNDFNFTNGATFSLKMSDSGYDFGILFRFVNWAFSDGYAYTNPSTIFEFGTVLVDFLFPEPIRPDFYKYSFNAIVRPLHHFEVDYDPSISILFNGGNTAENPPADAAITNAVGPAVGVVVAVVVIGAIAALFASPRFRRAILPYSARRKPSQDIISNDSTPLEQTSSASPPPSPAAAFGTGAGGWQNANTARAPLTNF